MFQAQSGSLGSFTSLRIFSPKKVCPAAFFWLLKRKSVTITSLIFSPLFKGANHTFGDYDTVLCYFKASRGSRTSTSLNCSAADAAGTWNQLP